MKPVIIYSLPRARSTAVLNSCKRDVKLDEPFAVYKPFEWEALKAQLNDPNTASKFFGIHLSHFPPARSWFEAAQDTHDIFVVKRDTREVCYSFVLACVFGWNKKTELPPRQVDVDFGILAHLTHEMDNFVRFFPRNATIIEYSDLPASHFDATLNTLDNQNSLQRLSCINNLEQVDRAIDRILELHGDLIDEKYS